MPNIRTRLPIGKLPASLLAELLARAPLRDPRVRVGPGIGLDCAVLELADTLLVFKSDPITFTAEDIGRYAVDINANDIATTGAQPRWFLVTLLLPAGATTAELAESIFDQIYDGCRRLGVDVIGGHTEITHGLDRPVIAGTMVGEVAASGLVTPRGARPGDRVLLTKGVPIETTAILAREFGERLRGALSAQELDRARGFLEDPGIGVLGDARTALAAGKVTAMHDPTEGGLRMALWELAQASGRSLYVDPGAVPVPELAARVCRVFGLDPLGAIASGALLLTTPEPHVGAIRLALEGSGVRCAVIGEVRRGPAGVWLQTPRGIEPMSPPLRDEIARVYEESSQGSAP